MKQFVILLISASSLTATTINIPADYSTIQEGINASADGDTILVAPGTYTENLILENEIVLASHAIYDDIEFEFYNNENINNTVISGIQNGSCLIVRDGDIQPTILGFTFQDGTGTSMLINNDCAQKQERSGGAILIYKAYPTINYNRFMNNGLTGDTGQNTTNGGAISHFADDDIEFDEDRNHANQSNSNSRDIPEELNIQNNYFENNSSGDGENFYSYGYDGSIDVSGSVFENIDCESSTVNDFVLRSIEDEADYIQNDISGNCIDENAYYVSPSGDNSNAGSESAPFRSIVHALTMVKQESDEVTTIHIGPGVYSKASTNEVFPIILPDNVHLIGVEMETTILDAAADVNNQSGVLIIKEVENVHVANLTLTGGYSESHGCTGGGALLLTANDMFNNDYNVIGTIDVVIENVIVENSHSYNGGGVSVFRVDGAELNNLIIRNNQASALGGGMFIYVSSLDMSNVDVNNNESLGLFGENNDMGHGGGIFLASGSGTYNNMTITENYAPTHGGGIFSDASGSTWTLTNSIVSNNSADGSGGGLGWMNEANPTLDNVTISNNDAANSGGGIWMLSNGTIENCTITGNTAGTPDYGGGGIAAMWGGNPVINNCLIANNISTASNSSGGGVLVAWTDSFNMTGSTITNNSSNWNTINIFGTPATISNCTVTGNSTNQGSAIRSIMESQVSVINSIVWGNGTPSEVGAASGGTISVDYSDVQGGYGGYGNINSNPLFVDANDGDFFLQDGSPCIDAGIADLDGDGTEDISDYFDVAPDMGSHEFVTAVSGLQIYNQGTFVILVWNPTEDVQYYALERSTDPEFESDVMTQYVTQNTYTDNDLEFNVMYYYRVSAFVGNWSGWSNVVSVIIESVGLADGSEIPKSYKIHQNYPNPFNPVTTLRYDLPEDGLVNITVYDMMGRVIKNLVNVQQNAGYKSIQWNGTNNGGQSVSAGLYFYTIQSQDFVKTKKMILLK